MTTTKFWGASIHSITFVAKWCSDSNPQKGTNQVKIARSPWSKTEMSVKDHYWYLTESRRKNQSKKETGSQSEKINAGKKTTNTRQEGKGLRSPLTARIGVRNEGVGLKPRKGRQDGGKIMSESRLSGRFRQRRKTGSKKKTRAQKKKP